MQFLANLRWGTRRVSDYCYPIKKQREDSRVVPKIVASSGRNEETSCCLATSGWKSRAQFRLGDRISLSTGTCSPDWFAVWFVISIKITCIIQSICLYKCVKHYSNHLYVVEIRSWYLFCIFCTIIPDHYILLIKEIRECSLKTVHPCFFVPQKYIKPRLQNSLPFSRDIVRDARIERRKISLVIFTLVPDPFRIAAFQRTRATEIRTVLQSTWNSELIFFPLALKIVKRFVLLLFSENNEMFL